MPVVDGATQSMVMFPPRTPHAAALPGTKVNVVELDPLNDSELLYWQGMREAMEIAGDTNSAIYKRAVSITELRIDPMGAAMTSTNTAH